VGAIAAGYAIDLHTHSLRSDGALSPADLVKRGAARGVKIQALSDHDTVAGVAEAAATGGELGVRIIAATELNTESEWGDAHILGYFIDPADSELEDRDQIGLVMDAFRSSHKRAISVLFTNGERAGVHVAVTDDLVQQGVKAGEIANAIAAVSGGKGGGRQHFASAGAGDAAKLGLARAQARAIVEGLLRR